MPLRASAGPNPRSWSGAAAPGRRLRVAPPGSAHEHEADQNAARVASGSPARLRPRCACGGGCPRCPAAPAHGLPQASGPESLAPPGVERVLSTPGQRLEDGVRQQMEHHLGHDFRGVRIHTGAMAGASARTIGAVAYTAGRHVVLDDAHVAPQSARGRELLAHELTHVAQQARGTGPAVVQRQLAPGAAARRTTTYRYSDCSDEEIEILNRNFERAYLMARHAREQMSNLILAVAEAEPPSPSRLAPDALALRHVIGRLFGADTVDVLRDIRRRFGRIVYRFQANRTVVCHDPTRHLVASAAVGGTDIWIGPLFFSRYSDSLDARPRILIHEMAHNSGLEHAMTGLALTAGEEGTRPAEVAHHSDSYAELAYRIYTGDFFGRLNRELEI